MDRHNQNETPRAGKPARRRVGDEPGSSPPASRISHALFTRSNERVWRVIRIVQASMLIGVGAVLAVLPMLPGIPLIVAGLILLGREYPAVRRWVDRFRERWARHRAKSQKAH